MVEARISQGYFR